MKANELRIGNYVNCPKDGQNPFRIDLLDFVSCGIGKFGMIYDKSVHPLTWYLQDLQPIPLTEEWLLKFGFKYQDRDVSHGNGHIERFYISPYFGEHREYWLELQLNNNVLKTYFAWLMWDIGGGRSFIHLPYGHKLGFVHKLQNVYFELSESELNLK